MSSPGVTLDWSHGRFEILPTAGMLASAEFRVDGQVFRPFARAEWMGTITDPAMAGHLRELGGEFVGVPFGSSPPPEGLSETWRRVVGDKTNATPHGPSADLDWRIASAGDGAVQMVLAYEESSPVRELKRAIRGRHGEATLDFGLEIHARRAARTSLGLHPIFRLPEIPGRLEIIAGFDHGQTYPGRIPPNRMATVPDHSFTDLFAVPGPNGPVDLTHLPLARPVEDVVLLGNVSGAIVLRYLDEGLDVILDWDRTIIPSAQLWISDRGAEDAPFNGRYRGLGVEPVVAAFDLADDVSTATNPLNDFGIATCRAISPDAPLSISYSVSVRKTKPLPNPRSDLAHAANNEKKT